MTDTLSAYRTPPPTVWYALTVISKQEGPVSAEIGRGLGLATYWPAVKAYRKAKSDQGRTLLIPFWQPLMPGYVFVRAVDGGLPWNDLKATRHVYGWVDFDGVPGRLSEVDIQSMQKMALEFGKPKPKPRDLQKNDMVKIVDGPFANFESLIQAVRPNGKIEVEVHMFGRPMPVVLEQAQVKKMEKAA